MQRILLLFLLGSKIVYSQDYRCIELESLDNIQNFQMLNEDLKAHPIILLGEAPHGVPANTFLQVEFFIYLNKHFGTRNLLIEFGSSDAYLLNKYLKTGESKYFEMSYYGLKKVVEAKKSMNKLFDYNKSLSNEKRLKIIGLDFEREPSLTATIYYFLEEFQDLPGIDEFKQQVKSRFDTIRFDNPKPFLKFLRKEIPNYEPILSQSAEWPQIRELIYFKSSFENFWSRDKFMIQRFLRLSPEERYLGSFGTMHTRPNEKKVFAGILQKNKNYKDKTLVIDLHHENSMYSKDKKIDYSFLNDYGFFSQTNIQNYLAYFNKITDCEIFISKIKPLNADFEKLMDLCDYVIFLRNQNGYTPEH